MEPLAAGQLDPAALAGRRVAVFGFGAQGRAHALNLRDSGVDVVVALRDASPRHADCAAEGMATLAPAAAARACDLAVMLVPDEAQPRLYQESLAPALRPGSGLLFAHGYNIHYRRLEPRADLDVVMVAPLGIGEQVRRQYQQGRGVPALLAVHQDASGAAAAVAGAYAAANGHARAAVFRSSFAAETETDLFAEQAVLCGGLGQLILAAFETLVEAGYPEEVAYFCCLHEVKLIADLVQGRGLAGMRRSISSTAAYGDATRGPRVVGTASREAMRELLAEIQDGRFAAELDAEMAQGAPTLAAWRRAAETHPIEAVGSRLRALMPWLEQG
ncbi:ketol-acid reductoisomerase [Thioalkalivibrio sp. XN8]|uniref:ketol-acid reductoisomerase n=1 Tax=Thioalkalivibrio sp. XN8 TaxID=2712863 RepID=UPI0013ECC0FC|nr:ketol-acid reductoisomerase [Thioalkalivibrio sp. XN8]NGP51912.1 ketol-acid reductoisomerase [Thioalkalivibrio sp. XN8]